MNTNSFSSVEGTSNDLCKVFVVRHDIVLWVYDPEISGYWYRKVLVTCWEFSNVEYPSLTSRIQAAQVVSTGYISL